MYKWPILFAALLSMACAKPLIRASAKPMETMARQYAADANLIYYAIRWALSTRGYPVASEDLHGGLITTAWVPTRSDSHYLQPFATKDYGVTPSYHQLAIKIVPAGGGKTDVEITSHLKSIVSYVQSNGREEGAILGEIANYLHSSDLGVTNIGAEE